MSISIDVLRELLPHDVKCISGWRPEKRAAFLDDWWRSEYSADRATRRALLREIAGMSYGAIRQRYTKPLSPDAYGALAKSAGLSDEYVENLVEAMNTATENAAPRQPEREYTETDYWAALAQLANFLKEITK